VLALVFSGKLVPALYSFLQTSVFHRSFEFEKWLPTIITLIVFPLFLVIAVNTLVFFRYSDKSKKIMLSVFLFFLSVLMIFCFFTRSNAGMDSDMASEILLAKECVLQKSLWPRTWHYSTELRLLNTQLVSAPLFLFTSNWITVKALTAVFTCLCMFFSLYFLLRQLRISSSWIVYLACILSICPCSGSVWKYSIFGNYYIPHIVMSFMYLGFFFMIMNRSETGTAKQLLAAQILFFVSAFIGGLSTIRYLIIYEFPLALTCCAVSLSRSYTSRSSFSFRNFFRKNRYASYSILGFLAGCIGYVFNSAVLSRLYTFAQWNQTSFKKIGFISFTRLHSDIFSLIGYSEDISALTPSGIINVLIYAGIIFFIMLLCGFFRNSTDRDENQFTVVLFSIVSAVFTCFLYVNCDYISRYFLMELAFFLPSFAVLLSDIRLKELHRYFFGICWAVIIMAGSFTTLGNVLFTDRNTDMYPAVNYLETHGYSFGYATFWHANVTTYITNGKIAVGNLEKKKGSDENAYELTDKYQIAEWLTPERYYRNDLSEGKHIFLLVSEAEFSKNSVHPLFSSAQCVFSDGRYRIYDFPDVQSFKDSYQERVK
jgi:hypothetical protein